MNSFIKNLMQGNAFSMITKKRDNSTETVLTGIIIGLSLGAVAGLLFAPRKGEQLRNEIKDTFNDLGIQALAIFNSEKPKNIEPIVNKFTSDTHRTTPIKRKSKVAETV